MKARGSSLIGGIQKFTAVARDQNGNVMTPLLSWTSSNGTVGTIDASGNFNALAAGTTTIKAANGTVNGTASVTVTVTSPVQNPVLTTIKVTPPTAKIIVGKTMSFMAKTLDQFNHKISAIVTWASSNTSVGTIANNGKFTALSAGTTTITATNGTINGSATITVKAKSSGHVDNDNKEGKPEEHNEDKQKENKEDKQGLEEDLDED
ncbi:MAG TPA: Ig-like domain-containing protein [Candidatus Methanoperedens sp.]